MNAPLISGSVVVGWGWPLGNRRQRLANKAVLCLTDGDRCWREDRRDWRECESVSWVTRLDFPSRLVNLPNGFGEPRDAPKPGRAVQA